METVFAYAFKPSKNYTRMVRHMRPTEGILCYTTDKSDYTEERNSMATIQPYFIPISKIGTLQWYKARKVDNLNHITSSLSYATTLYNADVNKHIRALQLCISSMSKLIIG